MSEVEVKGLFPTPLMTIRGAVNPELARACIERIRTHDTRANVKSALLRHTVIVEPAADDPLREVADHLNPYLVDFGDLLFGERLGWTIKELWTNVLEPGGRQAVHSHSNSFISGIVYLTDSHPSARTVFHRSIGGRDFIFANDNAAARIGQFNGSKWVAPAMTPGDCVLYPSYLLHEVPGNEGAQRLTIAFNAIPDRLDSWGYSIRFSSHRRDP